MHTIVAVIGGSQSTPQHLTWAEQVGQELARKGAIVVCGGLTGVMEAVCKGAKQEGGLTIGILPGSNPQDANPFVDIPICTGLGYARNAVVVKTARAVISIDGSFGTLSEIGHALAENIPVIGLDTWELAVNGSAVDSIIPATSPTDAVARALEAARVHEVGQGPTP